VVEAVGVEVEGVAGWARAVADPARVAANAAAGTAAAAVAARARARAAAAVVVVAMARAASGQ